MEEKIVVLVVTAGQVGKGRREGTECVKHSFYISIHFLWYVSTMVPELAVQMFSFLLAALNKAESKSEKCP